jgi:hypothetical protein
VQVYAGVLILSMRCTHPGLNRGLEKDSYLALFFLARRLRTFAAILRFTVLVPRLLVLAFRLLDLFGRVLCERSEVTRRRRKARSAVEDNGDLRPWRKAHTGALRSGKAAAEYSGMRARASTLPAGLAAA